MKKNFSVTPSVSITRSKFLRDSQRKTTIKLGEITPIYLDEVLPGDTRKIDMGALCRMNTPVAPIMDNVFIDYYAFYCPNRLLWNHWKEFMGENNTSAGIYTGSEFVIPQKNIFGDGISVGKLGDHFGLPIFSASPLNTLKLSVLPIRMYRLIYNEWWRDQNLIAPVIVNLSDTPNGYDNFNQDLFLAAKTSDYFTRSLPYAQKGDPVTIPLGSSAQVLAKDISGGNISSGESLTYKNGVNQGQSTAVFGASSNTTAAVNLYADLRNATGATINQLRFAFQYQKMLERDSLYGTRYWEVLHGHFSVIAPDSSLQRPELLGHWRQDINIDQVIQTTGINQSTPSANGLGQVAAVSVTGGRGNLVTKSFTEHGYIMILAVARHDQTYGQGVDRSWSRLHRTDYYFPVFANLGAQSVLNKEIYASGTQSDDEAVFGYQEAWAEYRYKPSTVTGYLRPNVTGLGFYTLANNFGQLPTLGQTFIEQGRSNVARAIGSFNWDFVCDFYFKDIAVRPMPVYSIPGLIDHH